MLAKVGEPGQRGRVTHGADQNVHRRGTLGGVRVRSEEHAQAVGEHEAAKATAVECRFGDRVDERSWRPGGHSASSTQRSRCGRNRRREAKDCGDNGTACHGI